MTSTLDRYAVASRDPYSPNYGDLTDYPKTLVIGDTVFPMLYIYYMGSANKNKVTDPGLFDDGLYDYVYKRLAMKGEYVEAANFGEQSVSDEITDIKTNAAKYYRMFTSAHRKNPEFMWQLVNTCKTLMGTYRARLPQQRPAKGKNYYVGADRKTYDYYPVLSPDDPNALANCMETLRLLVENRMLKPGHDLGIRPINLYDGSFASETQEWKDQQATARVLGLPQAGVFTVNKIPATSWMYHTFSGIDMQAVASMDSVVTNLEGLTSFSWSIHRGKQTQRVLGKESPSARSGGGRTIAGTMVFALSDHHPLLRLVPTDFPVFQSTFSGKNPEFWKPLMMADQMPPFDLVLTCQNEYGFASATIIYGIEIVDEGVVMGIDNLITEMVVQYTAVAMDPICQAKPDANGNIDPFSILSGQTSDLWRRREMVLGGAAYTDLESAWEAQTASTFDAVVQRQKALRKFQYEKLLEKQPKGKTAAAGTVTRPTAAEEEYV